MGKQFEYDVTLHWDNDRKGTISSPVLDEKIEVVTPPEFPKGIAGKWSPEHLYVASVNSCLMTTFLAIAENSRLEFTDFTCGATGKLEKVDGTFMFSEIILTPEVTIAHKKDEDRANRIIEKSEAACLISNSIKTKVIIDSKVNTAELTS